MPLAEMGIDKYIYTQSYPLAIHCLTTGKNNLAPENEEAHVEDGMRIIRRIAERGAPLPYAILPWNEPEGEGCYPERYMRLCLIWRQKLDAEGFTDVLISAPDLNGLYRGRAYYGEKNFEFFRNNPDYARICKIFSYHTYGNPSITPEIIETVRKGTSDLGMQIWSTETCSMHLSYNGDMKYANGIHLLGSLINQFRRMCGDIAWVGCDTWFQFQHMDTVSTTYSDYGHANETSGYVNMALFGVGYGKDGATDYIHTPLGDMYCLLTRNVEYGSIVHRMFCDDDESLTDQIGGEADMVAFSTPEKTTMILLNTSYESKYYNMHNIPGTSATQYYVDAKNWQVIQENKYNINNEEISKLYAPANSVNIIVTTNKDVSGPATSFEVKDSFYADGAFNVRNSNVKLIANTDEPAKINIGFSSKNTVDNQAEFNFTVKDQMTVASESIDELGNTTKNKKLVINYNPKYVGFDINTFASEVNNDVLTITGKTNAGGKIYVNENEKTIDDDLNFSIDVKLNQGDNVLEIHAADNDGNSSEAKKFNIFCDSIKPTVIIDNAPTTANQLEVFIKGSVSEPLNSLEFNGAQAIVNENLSFSAIVPLKENEDKVVIKATDKYQNIAEQTIDLKYTADSKSMHKVGKEAMARHTTEKITIDGNLEESGWNIDLLADKVVSGLPTSVTGFGVMWDNDYLYFAAKAEDDFISYPNDKVYQNDCFEVFINPSNKKKGPIVVGEDKQLFAGYIKGSKTMYSNIYDVNVAFEQNENGWTAEMAIPWSIVGIAPENGAKIGFDVQFDDNDNGTFMGNKVWCGASDNYNNTESYGTLTLAAPGENIIYSTYADDDSDTGKINGTEERLIQKNYVNVTLNDYKLETQNAPVIINYIPYVSTDTLKAVTMATFEAISDTQFEFTNSDGIIVRFSVGDKRVFVGNETIVLDAKPEVIDGGVYVDRSFLDKVGVKYLGFTYTYDDSFEERFRELIFTR